MATRINKYLSEVGYCSRREADRLIEKSMVKINGKIASLGDQVEETDSVTVEGRNVKPHNDFVYIALNKPVGITSTTDQKIRGNIIDFMQYPKRIFHVGRLDKDSEGLILMTNDGDIVNEILRAENAHEKEYIVQVDRVLSADFASKMSSGVPILNTITKPCIVEKLGPKRFKIILTEGMNRQIRRMCEFFGYGVVSLKRTRIMNITLDVPVGKYRYLTEDEKQTLFSLLNK
ncbi:MAG: 23S rRNA pseudouridine synthase F [Tenericutes bacterium HGW-Tenericutes-2]|jgi:pseudouridine synthase|nr:MAG: 23S rRNA pseudouridine synthase F [Tenericutes bacterium HGW-Tenericutes-2]